jgi:hypothetical protein
MRDVLKQLVHAMSLRATTTNRRVSLDRTAVGGCPYMFPLLFHKDGG